MPTTCIDCQHFHLHPEEPDLAEDIHGSDAAMSCDLGRFYESLGVLETAVFRALVSAAEDCSDFENLDGLDIP